MIRTLLIDDDEKLATLLIEYTERYGISIQSELNPRDALNRLKAETFDCVILDVMLPDMDGFEVLKHIRSDSAIPVVMLTARGEVTDRVVGLEMGADDYLPKPFDPRELVARISAVVKRRPPSTDRNATNEKTNTSNLLQSGDIRIDTNTRTVTHADNEVGLTTMEYQLLLLLASSPGKDFSRDEILSELKGTDNELFSRSVDILISRLRAKLKPAKPIQTVHGYGYCWLQSAPPTDTVDR